MKFPFGSRDKTKDSAVFSFEAKAEQLRLSLVESGKPIQVADWEDRRPTSRTALAELRAAADSGAGASIAEHHIDISPDLLARFGAATAGALNLPPPTSLALDLKPMGRIDEDSFTVKTTWARLGGQPIRVFVEGALLKADGSTWRVPEPLWSLYQAALPLSVPMERTDRFKALASLKAAWPEEMSSNVTGDAYLKDMRVHYASALSLKLRTLTPNKTDFDPILFGAKTHSNAVDEGRVVDEEWDNILSPRAQKLFAEDRFRREPGVRPVYVLREGEYVFVDPDLRPVLDAVRKLQERPEAKRRAFILNPRMELREMLGADIADRLPLEELFLETEQFSDRVAGVDVWRTTVLPWIVPLGKNQWVPEKFGLRVGDDYFIVPPANVSPLIERIETAQAAGEITANVEGLLEPVDDGPPAPDRLPITDQTFDAVRSLAPLDAGSVEANGFSEEGVKWQDKLAEKVFLVVRENFEEVEFAPLVELESGAPEPLPAVPDLLTTPLKAHQVDGFNWLVRSIRAHRLGGLLADDMGLGKTLQAITFMAWLQAEMSAGRRQKAPILIIAPTGLLGNWKDEIEKHLRFPALGRLVAAFGGDLKWLKDETAFSLKDIETGKAALNAEHWRDAGIVLTTYETLRDYHFSFARTRFGLIVYDEIQKLKNPVSQMTRACKTLNADFVLGMTGTPVENRLQDLWSVMDVISPGLLGASRDFERRYPADNPQRLGELKALMSPSDWALPHMLRRMKADALQGLPSKTIRPYQVDMPPVQSRAYAATVMRASALSTGGTIGRGGMLEILHTMRGISLHPVDPAAAPDDLNAYAQDSARLSKTLQILDDIAAQNEKALIFVESLAMQERLAGLIQMHFGLKSQPMRINGGVPGLRRQEMVRAFQQNVDRFDVMILSPKAGGVGLTLTTANHVIHLSRWWNPAVEDQATDRVFRIGQTKNVVVHLPMSVHPDPAIRDSSFDLRLDALLERKRQLTRDLFLPPEASEADLNNLFSEVINNQAHSHTASGTLQELKAEEPTEEQAKTLRPTLTLPGVTHKSGIQRWRAQAGKARPTQEIVQLFKDRDIRQVVIRDPYALATDRARSAQLRFIEDLSAASRSLETVSIEYAPEAHDGDDGHDRRAMGDAFSRGLAGAKTRLEMLRRSKKSKDDDFHDRFVELHIKHAGGAVLCHELSLGRGLEALYHDRYECTVVYSPPMP